MVNLILAVFKGFQFCGIYEPQTYKLFSYIARKHNLRPTAELAVNNFNLNIAKLFPQHIQILLTNVYCTQIVNKTTWFQRYELFRSYKLQPGSHTYVTLLYIEYRGYTI